MPRVERRMNLLWECDKRFTEFGCSRRLHNVSGSSSWVLPAWYSPIGGAASLARVSGELANARSHLGSSSSSSKIIEAILFDGNAYASCSLADKVFNARNPIAASNACTPSSNSVLASTLLQYTSCKSRQGSRYLYPAKSNDRPRSKSCKYVVVWCIVLGWNNSGTDT